ncbi:MAG: TetR family transcriptional regulator [Cryobacterium sp.]|nr:TetR family transcriptional regulator [Cryobacterium sp.]
MNEQVHSEVGLRERKRAATQRAIERAAFSLILEHGYDNVTVDMICEASMVSQRTFFNYFGTKEGVVVGRLPEPTDEQIEAFIGKPGAGILTDLVELAASTQAEREPDLELLRSHHLVMRHNPQLLDAQLAKMSELEHRFTQIVVKRFRVNNRPGTAAQLEDEARMVVSLAGGVMRYLMHSWSSARGEQTPRDLLRDAVEVLTRFSETERHLTGDASGSQ